MTREEYLENHSYRDDLAFENGEDSIGVCEVCGRIIALGDIYYEGVEDDERPIVHWHCMKKYLRTKPIGDLADALGMKLRGD